MGAHRKDTGNIGNNRRTWEITGVPLTQADDALSVSKMPKFTLKPGKNWGVDTNVIGVDGKLVYGADGKLLKQKV